jgi:clan AA aspartic protease
MGHVFAELTLSNPRLPAQTPVFVRALADTGALMLCLPQPVVTQLGLEIDSMREVIVANGHKQMVPYVGPVRIAFQNRSCFVGAFVLGDEVLLGVVPMEDMDLVVEPGRRSITVNPASPDIPQGRVKLQHRASRPAVAVAG